MTTHAQYIIHVDKNNIDYNNKGSQMRDSHMEITLSNKKKKCTQELMINNNIKKIMRQCTYLYASCLLNSAVFRCFFNVSFSSTVQMPQIQQ